MITRNSGRTQDDPGSQRSRVVRVAVAQSFLPKMSSNLWMIEYRMLPSESR